MERSGLSTRKSPISSDFAQQRNDLVIRLIEIDQAALAHSITVNPIK